MQLSRQDEPVYRELADILRRELADYQAGDFLPAEVQLAERFGVNRHTLRRAIDELVFEGSLLRRQGKGTQVLERPLIYPMAADSAYSQSLSAQGLGVEAVLLKRRYCFASREEAQHLGLAEMAPMIELQTLRKLDHQPVSLIRHRYCASHAPLLADYTGGSLRQYLQRTGPAADPHPEPDRRPFAQPRRSRVADDAPAFAGAECVHPFPRPRRPSGGAGPVHQPFGSLPVPGRHLMENSTMNPVPHTERQHWIGVLARARRSELQPHEAALRDIEYQLIRAPEIGMTLVRGRMGGNGAPFNVGEMSVTRCVVRLADGRTGYSYLAGRDKVHAELAALADAHLQGAQQRHWLDASDHAAGQRPGRTSGAERGGNRRHQSRILHPRARRKLMSAQLLQPAFTDPVLDAQRGFRAALKALAGPGSDPDPARHAEP